MIKLRKNKQRAVQKDFQKVSCKLEGLVEQLQPLLRLVTFGL